MSPSGTRSRPSAEIHCLTLGHRWGTAAMATSESGIRALSLLGGQKSLDHILQARLGPRLKTISARSGNPHLERVRSWLDALLNQGRYHALSVPLDRLPGTPFQESVWRAVSGIPRGEVKIYADIARMIGSPRASRAVGAANAANPIPPIIPCHRLVGADGGLKGYAGGTAMKRWLLDIEQP